MKPTILNQEEQATMHKGRQKWIVEKLEKLEEQIRSARMMNAMWGAVEDSPEIECMVQEREELLREPDWIASDTTKYICRNCGRNPTVCQCPINADAEVPLTSWERAKLEIERAERDMGETAAQNPHAILGNLAFLVASLRAELAQANDAHEQMEMMANQLHKELGEALSSSGGDVRICAACECKIDQHGCGCDPHDA